MEKREITHKCMHQYALLSISPVLAAALCRREVNVSRKIKMMSQTTRKIAVSTCRPEKGSLLKKMKAGISNLNLLLKLLFFAVNFARSW